MATEVILPKVDMDMATGRISRWLVAEGTAVKQGDPLFEIETDKVVMEVPAPAAGVLTEVLVADGGTVVAQQLIARIDTAAVAGAAAPAASAAPAPAAAAPGTIR